MSAEYDAIADELIALLEGVQIGVWQGPSTEEYMAAHAPYLEWLAQASADSATAAVQHDTVDTPTASALAAMPELAAHHVAHGGSEHLSGPLMTNESCETNPKFSAPQKFMRGLRGATVTLISKLPSPMPATASDTGKVSILLSHNSID